MPSMKRCILWAALAIGIMLVMYGAIVLQHTDHHSSPQRRPTPSDLFASYSKPAPVHYVSRRLLQHHSGLKMAAQAKFDFPVVPRLVARPRDAKEGAFKHVAVHIVPYDGAAFDINDIQSIVVLLHIQKTAGTTINRLMTERLDRPFACVCRKVPSRPSRRKRDKTDWKHCKCYRPNNDRSQWLFSRTTTGWKCGLHPGFSELAECLSHGRMLKVERRKEDAERPQNLFMITILRRPLDRFMSEFAHMKRGATWKNASHRCNGMPLTRRELPLCYQGVNWANASLEEFLACPYNVAFNRQTRMLANLSLAGCYYTQGSGMSAADYNKIILKSAMDNLAKLSWFGLTEYFNESQEMFEHRFGMRFKPDPLMYAGGGKPKSDWLWNSVPAKQLDAATHANLLDLQLYDFAEKLFLDRYSVLRKHKRATADHVTHATADHVTYAGGTQEEGGTVISLAQRLFWSLSMS